MAHRVIAHIPSCRMCHEEHEIEREDDHVPVMVCKQARTSEPVIVDTRYWMAWDYDLKKPTRVIEADYDGLLLVVHPEDYGAPDR